MLILTTSVGVLLVLDDTSIERMKQQDPVELDLRAVAGGATPPTIGVTYLDPPDTQRLIDLVRDGRVQDAVKFATRGFVFRPEKGDHDMGPHSLLRDEPVDA